MLAAGREFIAPGALGAIEPTARAELPLGLGRQILTGPFGVGQRVEERDVHDRMIPEIVDVALRSVGVAPIRTLEEGPPLTPFAQLHLARWRRENEGAGIEDL